MVLDPLAKMMVAGEVKEGGRVKVETKGKEIVLKSTAKKIKHAVKV